MSRGRRGVVEGASRVHRGCIEGASRGGASRGVKGYQAVAMLVHVEGSSRGASRGRRGVIEGSRRGGVEGRASRHEVTSLEVRGATCIDKQRS